MQTITSVEEQVIRRLRAAGDIDVEPGGPDDLVVTVRGGEARVLLEIKHRFDRAVLDELEALPRSLKERTVLAVPTLSARRRKELRTRGISWIEYRTGRVHLRVPGLAIELPEESSPPSEPEAVPSLAGKAGIVVEALIDMGREQEVVAQPDIARRSGSTQAWTSRVFASLVDVGALEVIGRGPHKQWRPNVDQLLDLWIADGGPAAEVTGASLWARTPQDLLQSLAGIGEAGVDYAIAGVAAANLHEPTLTTIPPVADVWLPILTPVRQVTTALGAEIIESGPNIYFWQASGDPALRLAEPLHHWRSAAPAEFRPLRLVSPGRAVVEALQDSGRAPEVGENLRRRIIREAEAHRDG